MASTQLPDAQCVVSVSLINLIYHVGSQSIVTLHWFILTRSFGTTFPTVHGKSTTIKILINNVVVVILRMRSELVSIVFGAHVVLLARTWADWTGENLRGWKKSHCAYMMRLLPWNGEWRRNSPLSDAPTSWQLPSVAKTHAPTKWDLTRVEPRRFHEGRRDLIAFAWFYSTLSF